jgi:hypothetical protein
VAKRTPENNRRKLIEEQRKRQRSGEKRATYLTIGITTLLGIALIGGAVYYSNTGENADVALRAVGVSAEAAACDAPKVEEIPKEAEDDAVKHTKQNGDRVEYPIAPPSSGRHNPTPLPVGAKKFYSREENAPPERAVHNLEHGYVVAWYDNKATDAQLDVLKKAADSAEGKFLIMAWTRQDFPGDKHIVLTSWAQKQACSDVSGAVFQDFIDNYGGQKSKAPEKNVV